MKKKSYDKSFDKENKENIQKIQNENIFEKEDPFDLDDFNLNASLVIKENLNFNKPKSPSPFTKNFDEKLRNVKSNIKIVPL